MEDNGLKLLSAFSGLGGLDLGLEAAGFQSVGCLEWDSDARRSLKANRGDAWPLIGDGDISTEGLRLAPEDVGLKKGQLALLAGAPPCQPFSKAAQWNRSARKGSKDPRHAHTIDFFHIAERFAPEFILIENVPGFVQGPTSALAKLRSQVRKLCESSGHTYRLLLKVLDAADFGVPQHRRRAIIVVTRSLRFEWPEPCSDTRTAWDAIAATPDNHDVPRPSGQWADLLPTIPEGANYLWHTDRGGGQPLFGYRRRYWSFLLKLDRNSPAPTLAASPGPSTGPFHWGNRPLSVWEMLRLQSFPSDWRVEGDRRSQVRQVGNATPPLLAEVLGRQIVLALGGEPPRPLTYEIALRSPAVGGLSIERTVPPKYQHLIGEYEAHPGTGCGPKPRTRRRLPPTTRT